MNTWVQVDKLQDGDPVNADTLNVPVDQLASRTDYLKRRLGSIFEDGVQSSIVLPNVPLDKNDTPDVGNVVYKTESGFRRAQAKMSLYDDFTADASAFSLGILVSKSDTTVGDVLIYGKLSLDGSASFTKSSLLEDGETFRPGRYYLSATEPGKLSSHPGGPLVYIGSFHDTGSSDAFSAGSVAYVNVQFLDIGTSHVHRAYPLVARPAGHVEDGHVIGYLPIGAREAGSSDSSSPEENRLPTLLFDGTWESENDAVYTFELVNGNQWMYISLKYQKGTNPAKTVVIPASDVPISIDDGLIVKVHFPEATKTTAYSSLTADEMKWVLTFPTDVRGWKDHCVSAIAESYVPNDITRAPEPSSGDLFALLYGTWPQNGNTVYVQFPGDVKAKTVTSATTTVQIGSTIYEFVAEGGTPASGHIAVTKGGTVNETLHNLAKTVSQTAYNVKALVSGDKLVVVNDSLAGYTESWSWGSVRSVIVPKGTVPVMVVYDADYSLLGDVIANHDVYTPVSVDNLQVTIFSENGSSYIYPSRQVLKATAYDPAITAVYDYAMGLHPEVDWYFPPVPAHSAGLFVNGVEMENAALFPSNPTYKVGPRTLHWMTSSASRRPWPEVLTDHDGYVSPALDKKMAFYFNVGFQCATGPVTSLVPAPDAPIKLYTYGTNDAAYTGDLMIDASFDFAVADANVQGYCVAKQGRGGKLLAGPVVERIKAGNGILVTQQDGCPSGQGTVTISADNGSIRNSFNEIALENAKQEKIGLFPYVSLLGWGESSNIPSAFTAMMRVPSNLEDHEYQLDLRMVMFGTAGYESSRRRAAGIQLEYNILPDYTDRTNLSLKTGLLIPDSARLISVPFGHLEGTTYKYVAYDPFVASTEVGQTGGPVEDPDVRVPFSSMSIPNIAEFSTKTPSLRPGYLLAIRVSRIATPDTTTYASYVNPVGFLSMEWTLK